MLARPFAGEGSSALSSAVCVSSAAACKQSRAVPQRPLFQEPGILFHKTWNGSIKKKLLCISTTFSVTFAKRIRASNKTPRTVRSKYKDPGGVYPPFKRSVIN